MKQVFIKTDYVTLGQFLKIADVISSGGAAKSFLESNDVLIDELVDNRRGRKLYPGTKVVVNKQVYEIMHE